jgi:hypothetical protein
MKIHEKKNMLSKKVENRYSLLVAKVEKYLLVGNQWLLAASEKVSEQAHKAGNFIEKIEVERKSFNPNKSIPKYFYLGRKWLLDTPERALESAYNAALTLNKIKDEHFAGDEITSISSSTDRVATYFQLRSKKHLLLIELRMMEFKVSNSIIDNSRYSFSNLEIKAEAGTIVDKLRLIDKVVNHYYETQPTNTLMPVKGCGIEIQQTSGVLEHNIFTQLGSQWKLLEFFQLPFQKEENSLNSHTCTTIDVQPQKTELQPQIKLLNRLNSQANSQASGYTTKNLGMASMLFAAGFVTGGICIPGVSSEKLRVNNHQNNIIGMRSDSVVENTKNTHLIPSPSVPENFSPELSFSMSNSTKPTEEGAASQNARSSVSTVPMNSSWHR